MARRIPLRNGDEFDAITRWRRYLYWRAGERARIKRAYRRRERRVAKEEINRCELT